MTLDDIAKKAFGDQFNFTELEAFCKVEHIAPIDFMESFTRHIVEGYIAGRYAWEDCDAAVNNLHPFVMTHSDGRIPDYPWEVFLAFDAGEYHPKTPALTPEEVTRPLIDEIVKKYHVT